MKITKTGFYQLTEDLFIRNPTGCGSLPTGTVIQITQIDNMYNKVIGPDLMDWMYNDLPVEEAIDARFNNETID